MDSGVRGGSIWLLALVEMPRKLRELHRKNGPHEAIPCGKEVGLTSSSLPLLLTKTATAHQDVESSHSSNVGPARVASGPGSRAPIS